MVSLYKYVLSDKRYHVKRNISYCDKTNGKLVPYILSSFIIFIFNQCLRVDNFLKTQPLHKPIPLKNIEGST